MGFTGYFLVLTISPGGGGGTCHVCIRGCACHVFGMKFHLKAIFWGSKICNMNFPILGGKKFQQLSFLLDLIL